MKQKGFIMLKKSIFCIALLSSASLIQSIVLESELLHFIDGNILSWDSVRTIRQYQKRIRHFLNEQKDINGTPEKIFDLAVKEKNGTLSAIEKEAFSEFVLNFISFSESFIGTLNPVKAGIAPIIEESCQKRNRQESLLLPLTATQVGTEKELFKTHIQTYRALAELCMDLLNFTEDLLSSCPKALKSYNDFFDRLTKIEPLVDSFLVADKIEISHHSVAYQNLIRSITEQYSTNENVTAEKTAKLYHAYNIKKQL